MILSDCLIQAYVVFWHLEICILTSFINILLQGI
jgi:hypothetical protein